MKIGFLGCGAMGSIYAGYLSKVHDVYVVDTWKEQVDAVKAHGINIEEPDRTVTCNPKFITTDPNEIKPVDILIVFVKYLYLAQALENARSMIDEHTVVLSLQNGLGNYDEIIKVVPEAQVCCGTTAHGGIFLQPGLVRHTGKGVTNIGTIKGSAQNVQMVATALRDAGFEVSEQDDVMHLIWKKLFANIAINGITALLQQENGMVAKNASMRTLAECLVREAITVANATGQKFDSESVLENVFGIALATDHNRSSMLQDVTRNRETEIKIINGAVVTYGKRVGIETPYNDAICKLIEAKQSLYHT